MYYIRLLKKPQLSAGSKTASKSNKSNKGKHSIPQQGGLCLETLITVTTDLGESFYPYDVELTVHVCLDNVPRRHHGHNISSGGVKKRRVQQSYDADPAHSIVTESKIQWRAATREQRVSVPVPWPPVISDTPGFRIAISTTYRQAPHAHDDGILVMPPVMAIEVVRERGSDGDWRTNYWRHIPLIGLGNTAGDHEVVDAATQRNYEGLPTLLILEAPPNAITAIERHVWDAGVAAAAFLPYLLSADASQSPQSALPMFSQTIQAAMRIDTPGATPFRVIELGCGCAPLSAALVPFILTTNIRAYRVPPKQKSRVRDFHITLTDFPEAEEIACANITEARQLGEQLAAKAGTRSDMPKLTTEFMSLAWEDVAAKSTDGPRQALPEQLKSRPMDLIMASDVTYNPRTSPALVKTMAALYSASQTASGKDAQGSEKGEPLVVVAMKIRHTEEGVFWSEMSSAGFEVRESCKIWCPAVEGAEAGGDEGEWAEVYVFRMVNW